MHAECLNDQTATDKNALQRGTPRHRQWDRLSTSPQFPCPKRKVIRALKVMTTRRRMVYKLEEGYIVTIVAEVFDIGTSYGYIWVPFLESFAKHCYMCQKV
ncbi:hypothetical protein AVEN_118188-1 [Araneus ventricosus]|uniref:Uncharacterized protein n=1 Tax=Araneus ventricosus TaxID=182803 RepID=A0A4Y2JXU7_ARAVE|nr:hypothetical protein AVEN_118188-1 [Araneus ventricosus]